MSYNKYNFSPFRYNNNRDFNNRNVFITRNANGFDPRFKPAYGSATPKRRSHCRLITKGDTIYVTGWKVGSKAGFRSFFVAPAKSGKVITSKTGQRWHACRVSIENKTHGTNGLFPGLINEATKKVFIRSLNIMMNPNTGFISYLPKKGR